MIYDGFSSSIFIPSTAPNGNINLLMLLMMPNIIIQATFPIKREGVLKIQILKRDTANFTYVVFFVGRR